MSERGLTVAESMQLCSPVHLALLQHLPDCGIVSCQAKVPKDSTDTPALLIVGTSEGMSEEMKRIIQTVAEQTIGRRLATSEYQYQKGEPLQAQAGGILTR